MRQLRRLLENCLRFLREGEPNCEVVVLAPFAIENLDRISTSPLYLAVSRPGCVSPRWLLEEFSRVFSVKVYSDPEVDVALLVSELFIWRVLPHIAAFSRLRPNVHLDVESLLSVLFWVPSMANCLLVIEGSCCQLDRAVVLT